MPDPEDVAGSPTDPPRRVAGLEEALRRQISTSAHFDRVAHAAIRAETLDDAIRVGAMLTGWPVGHAYLFDQYPGELASSGIRHLPDAPVLLVVMCRRTTSLVIR